MDGLNWCAVIGTFCGVVYVYVRGVSVQCFLGLLYGTCGCVQVRDGAKLFNVVGCVVCGMVVCCVVMLGAFLEMFTISGVRATWVAVFTCVCNAGGVCGKIGIPGGDGLFVLMCVFSGVGGISGMCESDVMW